jgi:predicted transcriptional regulator
MLPSERIETIMTEAVLSISHTEGASEVLRYFASYPIHHLPVVDGSRVVGMLSTADVMKLEYMLPRSGGHTNDYLDQRMKAGSLLRGPAITIRTNQTLDEAANLMARHAIHALAVVNAQDNLVGIVTTTDIISSVLQASTAADNTAAMVHLRQRVRDLEEVLRLTERYLSAGQDEQLHAALTLAIARLRSGTEAAFAG